MNTTMEAAGWAQKVERVAGRIAPQVHRTDRLRPVDA